MKILLIYPPFQIGEGMGKVMRGPPLSLMMLAGAIKDLNHEVKILDLNVNSSFNGKELEQEIKKYDLVGITCMSNTFKAALNICKIAKRYGVTTILGGFHPTLAPEIIEKFNEIDVIVRGEGELTFRELVNGVPKKEILGISYRENGKVYHNPDRPQIKNLDDLPFPSHELLPNKPYHYLWIPAWVCETSRGCPFTCKFCCVTQFHRGRYRTKSPKRVIKELMMAPERAKLIFFVDDNFTLNSKRVIKICKLLKKTKLYKKFKFVCQSRVDDIANNPKMIEMMSDVGFICVFLGFESFKQMSLNHMNKNYTLDKVKICINLCHKNGILIFGSFIIGNIGESKNDTLKTFKLMKELEIDLMMTSPITPFPGTPLHQEAVKNGWIKEGFKWEDWDLTPVMKTPTLSIEDIHNLVRQSYKFFYKDLGYFLFGKKIFRILFNRKFRWYWRFAWNVFTNGISKFFFKI
ncbi:MAG: B12-binding domain-containing radical SAM protein [Promethearchaeota archaeon]